MPATDSSNKPSILKNTREAKGLSLEIVHEATKIPMDALKSIEEGYSTRILSPFYYRGFIKIYAEFLGLDVAEMYKEYGLNQATKPTQVLTPIAQKSNRKESKPNVFLEQSQEFFAVVFKPGNLMVMAKLIGIILAIFFVVKFFGFVAGHFHKKASVKKQSSSWAVNAQAKEQNADNQKLSTASMPAHDTVKAQSQDNQVELAIRAPKDIWIRVKADDKTVFAATLSKGSLETWTANDQIELSGRDLERLDMEVNGKHIGSLSGSDRRIRRVVITQEGLTVKK